MQPWALRLPSNRVPCNLYRCDLPLLQPLTTARGTISARTTWVVEIVADLGARGLGEAAPLPGFGGEAPEVCERVLHQVLPKLTREVVGRWLERGKPDAPLGHVLEPLLAQAPCARHAIEGALIDLLAQDQGQPVAALLAEDGAILIPVNALVDGAEDARWAIDQGFRTVKAKIGGDPAAAAQRAADLRRAIGAQAHLRLDANGAWNFAQALAFCAATDSAQLELLEQPLAADQPDLLRDLANLRRQGNCRVGVDESIRIPADVGRIGAAQAADVVVLKPMFLGGWRPTSQAIQLAHTCGLGAILSSALEGSVGIGFAAHMAAASGLTAHAHGLATSERLEADLTTEPLVVRHGNLLIRERPGLGIGRLLV